MVVTNRFFRSINRRTYSVPGSQALWHLDGNHKLIRYILSSFVLTTCRQVLLIITHRWRLVFHGAIDGYSRLITFLCFTSNNRAQTVLCLFVNAIQMYGLLMRVRCDKGVENYDVAIYVVYGCPTYGRLRNGITRYVTEYPVT